MEVRYRGNLDIGSMEVGGKRIGNHQDAIEKTDRAVYNFLKERAYKTSSQTNKLGYETLTWLTPDGIAVEIGRSGITGNYDRYAPVDAILVVDLYSFTTPVNDLAEELRGIALQEAKKYLSVAVEA